MPALDRALTRMKTVRVSRVSWDAPGTTVRGVFLGPPGHVPENLYGYVATPAGTIQEFCRTPVALAPQLAVIPPGALLIIKYVGNSERQRKLFRVQWKRASRVNTSGD